MITRRAVLIAALAATGCRPRLSIPRFNGTMGSPPPLPDTTGQLLAKALSFEQAMDDHLTSEGLVVTERRLPPRPNDPLNAQDSAIWTGCYVASEAFRWMATHDPAADERLTRGLDALHLLHDVTGVSGVMARIAKRAERPVPGERPAWRQGVGPWRAYRWMGDVSVDQYTGVFFGYAAAFEAAQDDARRRAITDRVTQLVDRLVAHGWQIVDADGRPTKHSDLSGGAMAEPLNALLALSFAASAAAMSGHERFTRAYDALIDRGYARRAVRARDPWWEYLFGVNHSDNNLAYLGLYPLMRFERNPERIALYRQALGRVWGVVRAEGNPFFTFATRALHEPGWSDGPASRRAVEALARFPFPKRDEPRLNSARRDVCRSWFDDRHGDPQACAPLPLDERPRSSFEWASNPYRMDRRGDAATSLAGIDYLLAYWLGRRHDFLSSEQ